EQGMSHSCLLPGSRFLMANAGIARQKRQKGRNRPAVCQTIRCTASEMFGRNRSKWQRGNEAQKHLIPGGPARVRKPYVFGRNHRVIWAGLWASAAEFTRADSHPCPTLPRASNALET